MQTTETTVRGYLESLPPDRRKTISVVRQFILKHLPKGYEEGIEFGMLSYHIPLKHFPDTYNGKPLPILALASQKNYNSLYLMSVYSNDALMTLLENGFRANSKKLEMGKSCLIFKRVEDLHLPTLAEIISAVPPHDFIAQYKRNHT
jgi:hypothetical protein